MKIKENGWTFLLYNSIISVDSAKKRNRKKVLANYKKTRINIGHQHDRWMELKEAFIVQTHAGVSLRM
jgi:hypothetical protein